MRHSPDFLYAKARFTNAGEKYEKSRARKTRYRFFCCVDRVFINNKNKTIKRVNKDVLLKTLFLLMINLLFGIKLRGGKFFLK